MSEDANDVVFDEIQDTLVGTTLWILPLSIS